jgi:hypothetical protein
MGRSQVKFFNNPFKKRKELEFEFITKDIPLSTIMRWYLYDVALGEPNEMSTMVGLNPVSQEGDDKEQEDSDVRLDNIEYILPFLNTIAEMGADVISAIQVDEITKADPDNVEEISKEMDMMKTMYKVVALSALIGGFSTAMEIGLIAPGELTGAGTIDAKELDNE